MRVDLEIIICEKGTALTGRMFKRKQAISKSLIKGYFGSNELQIT